MAVEFDYDLAFERNIGWTTEFEQQQLRGKKIAVAGLGGVGGVHLLSLARLGIGYFHIADLDDFDLANFNRQIGAALSTVGEPKTAVLAKMTRDINPEIELTAFDNGVDEANLDAFLDGADLFVDGLDFFAFDVRAKIFSRCAERGIPAITAAPIGMGVSYLIFMPGSMTFEQYFAIDGESRERQCVHFTLGLTPRQFQLAYLVDPTRLDLTGDRGPSHIAACNLCAGVVAAESVKILLRRGSIRAAPWCHQYDPYRGKSKSTYLFWGSRNPLQLLKRHIGYRRIVRITRRARPHYEPEGDTEIEKILGLAKWAPSGDNAQPWQFEILGDDRVDILLGGPDHDNIYEYGDGEPTLLSGGFLIESVAIAASRFGRVSEWTYRGREAGRAHRISLSLPRGEGVAVDPLHAYLAIRSVDRRRYRRTPLTGDQKRQLEAALGPDLAITWFETLSEKWRMARVNAAATNIRLRLRETYEVHEQILDWDHVFSPDGVPVSALGLDTAAVKLMAWFMSRWSRLDAGNRYLGATLIPRLEMDILPGLACAAHFAISMRAAHDHSRREIALLNTGRALQRLWLTATRMGLAMQPGLAPLCFAAHGRAATEFSGGRAMRGKARRLAGRVAELTPGDAAGPVFLGRVGVPRSTFVASRSVRKPLESLLLRHR